MLWTREEEDQLKMSHRISLAKLFLKKSPFQQEMHFILLHQYVEFCYHFEVFLSKLKNVHFPCLFTPTVVDDIITVADSHVIHTYSVSDISDMVYDFIDY